MIINQKETEKKGGVAAGPHISSGISIRTFQDHIWFYDEINDETALEFNKLITELGQMHAQTCVNGMFEPVPAAPIWLHINSNGGYITSAMSMVDTIKRIGTIVPIITIVEGCACSAATFLSLVGNRRVMRENSYMLIHQLSGAAWGKYEEMKDDMKNSDKFMKDIIKLYKKYTKIPTDKLNELLKHDIYFDSKLCEKLGLVDSVIV
jgi:ATP-dependent Clp protease protease subunit